MILADIETCRDNYRWRYEPSVAIVCPDNMHLLLDANSLACLPREKLVALSSICPCNNDCRATEHDASSSLQHPHIGIVQAMWGSTGAYLYPNKSSVFIQVRE